MTLTWNPGGDFAEVADALEAVTLTATGGSQTSLNGALRLRITEQEVAASGGRYTRSDVKWHLPASEVPTAPEIGATITDSGGRLWTILRVDHDTRSSRWRCWCRSLEIAGTLATLTQHINIQQATWSKDDHGALAATWSDWKINLSARIQPLEAQPLVEHDQRFLRATHRVYLADAVDINARHRIQQPATGETFHIVCHQSASSLDELFTIHATKTPWTLA